MKCLVLQLTVTCPNEDEDKVEEAINAALNEPPCDWQDWTVGAASVVTSTTEPDEEGEEEEEEDDD